MMTYFFEIISKNGAEWTVCIEKLRANSQEEACADIKEAYRQDAVEIRYWKAMY